MKLIDDSCVDDEVVDDGCMPSSESLKNLRLLYDGESQIFKKTKSSNRYHLEIYTNQCHGVQMSPS